MLQQIHDDEARGAAEGGLPDWREARTSDPYLVTLGQRVRDMRAVRGMSRKVLSRVSGISERYIAQLESGQGNVSILLLRRVCAAIGARLEDLIAEPGAPSPDWLVVRDLLRSASPEQIAQARAVLSGASADGRDRDAGPARRVALIGLRGAGKSTLGRMVAERLDWPFVELNREIEQANGLSIPEIFALYGQDGYRRFEGACLRELVGRPGPMILATGGGVVAEPLTFDLLLSSFFTIWLKASPEDHMARVRAQGDLRPMADDRAAMEELRAILTSRDALYARASASVDTSTATLDEAAGKLVFAIEATLEPASAA
jgi:XRE family aerobic/anaerobic benzoate catabolism transcriptional regulator